MSTTNQKPLILITNDDGDTAKGIEVLTRVMLQLGDVVVVSPDGQRSGQSNALTVNHPIRYEKIQEQEGLIWYTCTGTPTDWCRRSRTTRHAERSPDGASHPDAARVQRRCSGGSRRASGRCRRP